MIAGADAFRGRWAAVFQDSNGSHIVEIVPSFVELIARDVELLVIDVPIGLLDRGHRACDVLARRMLGARGSSVFPAPIRPMLGAASYEEACRRRFAVDGKKCSLQAYGMMALIADVDRAMTVELQGRVREGHPEVSFATMNGGTPPEYSKRTAEGRAERMGLLAREYPEVRELVGRFRPRSAVGDVIDAFAMLWTAARVRAGTNRTLVEEGQCDDRGLMAEIVI
jgi:predicted RNase H-like nuclease